MGDLLLWIYIFINTVMLFIKNIPISSPPWRVQNIRRGIIFDQDDRHIATVPKAGEIPFPERSANLAVICAAPELLAALREAAYHLENAGVPLNQSYYDLINRASEGVPPLTRKQPQGPAVSG
jgi:hypothetical protein